MYMIQEKVDVIMSIGQWSNSVNSSISSILNQTHENFNFLIMLDGIEHEIADRYINQNDERIKIFYNEKNEGLSKSLNKLLKNSFSDIIFRMDADDISHKHRFEKQINFLSANPSIDILGTFVMSLEKKTRHKFPEKNEEIKLRLLSKNALAHPTIMIKREVFNKIGLYNEEFEFAQDYELWLRASQHKSIVFHNIPEYLLQYSTSKKRDRNKRELQLNYSIQANSQIIQNLLCKFAHSEHTFYDFIDFSEQTKNRSSKRILTLLKIFFIVDDFKYIHNYYKIKEICYVIYLSGRTTIINLLRKLIK